MPKQEVPPMVSDPKNVGEDGTMCVASGGYSVRSWSSGKVGEGVPASQVHLVIPVVAGIDVALRLKSARALDELVAVLLQHRKDVWPNG